MTKLELLICEAENNGEIDINTRDELLEVLIESNGLFHTIKKIKSNIKDTKVEDKQKQILSMLRSNDFEGAARELKIVSRNPEKFKMSKEDVDKMTRILNQKTAINKFNKSFEKIKNQKLFKNVKESVDDIKIAIYESELCGDITPEERDILIKNINEKSEFMTEWAFKKTKKTNNIKEIKHELSKSQKDKIEKLCRKYAESLSLKYDKKLLDKDRSFKDIDFYFYDDYLGIDFKITQDDYFNLDESLFITIEKELKNIVSDVIKISETYFGDDCPFLRLYYN